MIKIYFDWNVMAQMKDGQHHDLKEIVFGSERFIKPYSTSHISDILSSFSEDEEQNKRIKKDLEFISELTNNYFLFNDGKNVMVEYALPDIYYEQRVKERETYSNLDFDKIFKSLAGDELLSGPVQSYLNILKNMPLDDALKNTFDNPDSAKQMEEFLPGLKDDLTMGGFLRSFGSMFQGLNEGERYKDLRNIVQAGLGINRDKIFDSKLPYDLVKKGYEKIGLTNTPNIDNSKYGPLWFNTISNEYIQLDMYGYQEDRVSTAKGRKETFKNTTEDAFHSAFATTCNFYVINDNKSYKKVKQVYEKLGINTLVLKPSEFVKYYEDYLFVENDFSYIEIIPEIIEKLQCIEENIEDGVLRTYYLPYHLFDFFNKIVTITSSVNPLLIVLCRIRPTNGGLHTFEISALVSRLIVLFGIDADGFGEIEGEELEASQWRGRKWKIGKVDYRLISINDYVQLYLEIERVTTDS